MAALKLIVVALRLKMDVKKPILMPLFEEIALKMTNPFEVKQIVLTSNGSLQNKIPWMDLSLATGYPGLLLLFATLESAGVVKEGAAHQYVLAIHQSIEREPLSNLSLYNGVSGICFALRQASHCGTRYQLMQQKLDNLLLEHIQDVYLKPLREHRKRQESAPSALHDLIQGLPGIGRYLLEDLSLFDATIESILKELVELSKPFFWEGRAVPGWHLSSHDHLNTRSKKWPKGNFNLGLAHGIPGILAFLSIATLKGVIIDGQIDAMTRIAGWIQQHADRSSGMIQWHSMIPFEGEKDDVLARDAWCYGVPGIARSLFLCGKALGDQDLVQFAIDAFRGIFSRTREDWHLPGPMICHGIAGLLLITDAMANDLKTQDLMSQVEQLQQLLLANYQPNAPFGYQDLQLAESGKWQAVNSPGLLEGTAGVLLTLLMPKTKWHLPFLINV